MKKSFYLIFALLLSCNMFSQTQDLLFHSTWYLVSLRVDGQSYEIPFNQEVTNVTIDFHDTTPYTVSAMVCGIIDGEIEYPNNFELSFPTALAISGGPCIDVENQDFENVFFEFFNITNNSTFTYDLLVVDPGPPSNFLIITSESGDVATFTDEPRILDVTQFNDKGILVYPNPVSETLYINSNSENDLKLKIMSVQGTVLFEKFGKSISLEGYSKGVYFLEITNTEGVVQVEKVIKK